MENQDLGKSGLKVCKVILSKQERRGEAVEACKTKLSEEGIKYLKEP
jgi:hypothetical protein